MIRKRNSLKQGKVIVVFEIPGTIWAERINLVGDFNDWNCESLPFQYNHAADWHVELELDAGCEYRFRYLVNGGQWCDDWHADRCVPNAQDGYDSIVVAEVPSAPDLWRFSLAQVPSKMPR